MTEAPESITGEQFIAHAQYSNEGLAWHIDRLLKENARLTKLVATSERLRMEDAFARIREQAAEPRCECPRAFDVTRSELMLRLPRVWPSDSIVGATTVRRRGRSPSHESAGAVHARIGLTSFDSADSPPGSRACMVPVPRPSRLRLFLLWFPTRATHRAVPHDPPSVACRAHHVVGVLTADFAQRFIGFLHRHYSTTSQRCPQGHVAEVRP
jgi:hypothetical protein